MYHDFFPRRQVVSDKLYEKLVKRLENMSNEGWLQKGNIEMAATPFGAKYWAIMEWRGEIF